MLYIFPRFDSMPAEMQLLSRLYAYPTQPDAPPVDGFTLLDSGAFGLAQYGRQINRRHAERLAEHYRPFADQPGYYCIAPDVFLDPAATMRNWSWWQETVGLTVVPVIQFPKRGRIDVYAALRQARFYAGWRPEFVCISNPMCSAIESEGIVDVCALVRQIAGARWLHYLGAGWWPQDVAAWRDLGCFNSIDSIAYYTDAKDGWLWRADGGRERSDRAWRDLALENALAAAEIAQGDL